MQIKLSVFIFLSFRTHRGNALTGKDVSVSSVMRFHVGGAAEVEFLTTFVSLHVLISALFSTQIQLTLCRTVSSKNKMIHFSDITVICTNVCCFLGLPGISITFICCWDKMYPLC